MTTSFNCGICLSVIDGTVHPAPSSYATLMPCCNFPIHLRCAKLSFNQHLWSCPSCRRDDSLKTDESKARFITYLYLRSNFIPDRGGSLDSNIQAIKRIFGMAISDGNLLDVTPIDGEPSELTRKRFITFYDEHVLPNLALRNRLSTFFDKIFAFAESSTPLEMMDVFINFETPGLAGRALPIARAPRNPRCEKIVIYSICTIAIALFTALLVVLIKKHLK